MSLQKSAAWILLVADLAMILIFLATPVFWYSRRFVIRNGLESEKISQIYRGQSFSKTVVFPTDNMQALFLRLNNPGIQNNDPMVFRLKRLDGTLLAQIPFSGANVAMNSFERFQLTNVTKKIDEPLIVELESESVNAQGSIEIYYDANNEVLYRIYTKKPISEVIKITSTRLVNRFNRQGILFKWFYIGILLASLGLLIRPQLIIKLVRKQVIKG